MLTATQIVQGFQVDGTGNASATSNRLGCVLRARIHTAVHTQSPLHPLQSRSVT